MPKLQHLQAARIDLGQSLSLTYVALYLEDIVAVVVEPHAAGWHDALFQAGVKLALEKVPTQKVVLWVGYASEGCYVVSPCFSVDDAFLKTR
jgi:hypothetical protein